MQSFNPCPSYISRSQGHVCQIKDVSTTLCSGDDMLGGTGTQNSTLVAFARNFVSAPRSITWLPMHVLSSEASIRMLEN